MVSLPTYDNNLFARGISAGGLREAAQQQGQAAAQPRDAGALPAGLDVQARRRHRRPGRREDHATTTKVATKGYLTLGSTRFYDWNHARLGACDIYCGFGHSSDTFFFQMAGMLGIDRLGYWAKQYGFGEPTGIDLPGEVAGIVPTNAWKQDGPRRPDLPGRDLPGRDRAGLRRGHADPADQRLCGAGQRRHALPAADRARDRRTGRHGRPPVRAQGPPQDRRSRRAS